MRRFPAAGCRVLVAVATLAASSALGAQQKAPPPKRGQAIEIRGQVPTPQVVTVRPREIPAYDRTVLAPAFYDGSGSTVSTAGVQLVPESQLRGTSALDTLPGGIAREGGVPTVGPMAARADSARAGSDSSAVRAGTSAAEIEAMRHELAMRRARLDSLQRLLSAQSQTPVNLGKEPAKRMSSADSAARAEEIASIRRELEYRRQRLDSLRREVNKMGRGRRPAAPKKTTTDSTAAPPKTKRGRE